jgi:hypothetical protein
MTMTKHPEQLPRPAAELERLERIERALSGGPSHDGQKTALRTAARAGLAQDVTC